MRVGAQQFGAADLACGENLRFEQACDFIGDGGQRYPEQAGKFGDGQFAISTREFRIGFSSARVPGWDSLIGGAVRGS